MITDAFEHIEKGEVKILNISERQITIQVKDHLVTLKKKNGRTVDSCDCPNHAKFCNENPRCSHKMAAETYITMKRIKW